MAIYGFDEINKEVIPQVVVEENKIVASSGKLGKDFNEYLSETVAKMLLAKNRALLQDKTKILADNIRDRENGEQSDEKLMENYLASHLIEKEGKAVDNMEDMREFVKDKFLFVISDSEEENAWIHNDKEGKNVLGVTTKMLGFAKNSSQLEGVVAHELGHFFVREIYNEAKSGNVDETLADKHAIDMLYYMGKNPDEYRVVMEDVLGLLNMSELEQILSGIADEHGSPKSRVQAIENYIEVKYGDYVDEIEENTEALEKIERDDEKFDDFKKKFEEEYDSGRYVGYLESKFMEDERFSFAIDKGRIDFSKVGFEDGIDKLNELLGDENFSNHCRLQEAGEILSKCNGKDNLDREVIAKKGSLLIARASNSVCLQGLNYRGEKFVDRAIEDSFRAIKRNDYPFNLSRVLLDEAKESGVELGSIELADRMGKILEEKGVVLDGKEAEKIEYNGREVFVGGYEETKLLSLRFDKDESFLSEELKNSRAKYLFSDGVGSVSGLKNEIFEGVDKLSFALCFPELDLDGFENRQNKAKTQKEKDNLEKEFISWVLSKEPIKLDVPSMFEKDYANMNRFMEGESTYLFMENFDKLKYSRLGYKMPEFVMPKEQEAVGKKLPWSEIWEKAELKEEVVSSLKKMGVKVWDGVNESVAGVKDFEVAKEGGFEDVYSSVRFEGEKYDFVADDEGKITNVGQKAREIKENSNAKDESNEALSNNFREQMKVFDALVVLGEYQRGEDKSEQKTNEAKESLAYLMGCRDVEQYLLCKGLEDELRKMAIKRDNLDYEKMGNDDERINRDFEVLRNTKIFQKYGKIEKDVNELSIDEKKKIIVDSMRLGFGDKTGECLAEMMPYIIRLEKARDEENYKEKVRDIASGIASLVEVESLSEEIKVNKVCLKAYDSVHEKGRDTFLMGLNPPIVYKDGKIDLFEKVREENGFAETKGNPDKVFENLRIKSQDEKSKGASLAIVCFSSENFMPEYEVLRYINDKENPKLDLVKLVEAFPKLERWGGQSEILSSEFKDKLSDYMLNGGFKELSFYEQKEVFDNMCHKEMFSDKDGLGKVAFLEELKKSYQKLPENEKEEASLLMLKDRKFEYEAYNRRLGGEYSVKQKENVVSAMTYAPIRNYFVEEYTDRLALKMGKEPVEGDKKKDGSVVDSQEVVLYQNKVVGFMNMVNRDMALGDVKDKLFEVFADKIEAQRETAEKFEVAVKHQDNDRDLGFKNEASARVISSVNQFLDICPKANMELVEFLREPYSRDNAEKLRNNLGNDIGEVLPKIMASYSGEEEKPLSKEDKENIDSVLRTFSNEDLMILHTDFWDKGLEERAMVGQRLLENYAKNNVKKTVDVVLSSYIGENEPWYKETKDVLNCLYENGSGKGYYRKDKSRFMMGAMLFAKEPVKGEDKGQKMGVGEALAQFCSSNGPAWVKFGQALSNVNGLPDDIRRPMAVLKDSAVKKKRWEIFQELRENLGQEKLKEIRKVGKLLGAGSFFSSLSVEFQDGEKNVLQMMRPKAKKEADSEFLKIMRTVRDLAKKDSMYSVLGTIVDRANESTKTEVDIKKGYEQYVEAHKSYNAIESLEVNGVKFNINLCPWTNWSYDEKSGTGFKAMEFGEGKSLPKLDCNEDEKKIIATGYVATELSVLLSGRAWDIDRHSGQQNFDVKRDEKGNIKEVDVNIFDTGALRKPPTEEEKLMIANFYASVVRASVKGENISEVMFREVEKLEKRGLDASYVSDVQRGSIALSDIVEYQKEEKDNNGKVIKPSKSLSEDDFVEVFGAVVNSGVVDHKIMDNMVKGIIKDKELVAKIAMQKIKGKVKDFMGIGEKKDAVKVKLVGKSTLQRKRENEQIDDKFFNTKDNPFKMKEKSAKMSKEEKKDNKFVRNLEAWYLKKNRG